MDALVYDDTPLATYFEGEAVPYDLPRDQTPPPAPFAPRGLPDFKGRLRKIRRSATSIAPGSAYTEGLLERFRYLIVASQLLSDETGPRPSLCDDDASENEFTTLRGAVITSATSFLFAWTLHWLKVREKDSRILSWTDIATYSASIVLLAVVAAFVGRRQYTNHLQRASVRTLSKYVDDSHNLDNTANNVVRFIQEVEIVARGYDLGSPLPPITRLEDRQIVRRCQILRRELATALQLLTILMVRSHNAIQPYINTTDLQRYHDIYEVSLVEYSQAIELANQNSSETEESLKELRFSIRLHSLARKVFLCDLLALHETTGWSRPRQWSNVLRSLREAELQAAISQKTLASTLAEEEWGKIKTHKRSVSASSESDTESVQENPIVKKQLRCFGDITQSIRALNAKVHVMQEKLSHLTSTNSEDAVVTSTLTKQYKSLGDELRSLLTEWERGRPSMRLTIETDHNRNSYSTSSARTPVSISSSPRGVQLVDGGPADAFKLLTGDSPSAAHTKGLFEEEIFEAVARRAPRKRSASNMTREEKITKLAEDRRKRATLQEQADNTTSMLRELQMVIKHRPKPSLSGSITKGHEISGHRVATL